MPSHIHELVWRRQRQSFVWILYTLDLTGLTQTHNVFNLLPCLNNLCKENKGEPSTEPCSTPLTIISQYELSPFTLTQKTTFSANLVLICQTYFVIHDVTNMLILNISVKCFARTYLFLQNRWSWWIIQFIWLQCYWTFLWVCSNAHSSWLWSQEDFALPSLSKFI